jgi:predicted nucleic acid-binding protein
MRLVVADTGPINYLILIEAIEVLPKLFQTIFTPRAVRDELAHVDAPPTVRAWAAHCPAWLEVRPNPDWNANDATAAALDEGERAAIALAIAIGAELILMDDRAGVAVAYQRGLTVTGTLGVLDLAARRGLIDLAAALGRLKATSFFDAAPKLWTRCLHSSRRGRDKSLAKSYPSASSSVRRLATLYHHHRLRQPQPGP